MSKVNPRSQDTQLSFMLEADHLQRLLTALKAEGYQLIGPTVQNNVITYGELSATTDLPVGYIDEQEGGSYRLQKTSSAEFFGYSSSPHSWKSYLYPSSIRLLHARRRGDTIKMTADKHDVSKYAFIGVRACEIAAIAIQDKVLMEGPYHDPIYKERRKNLFIVAVNCSAPSANCFCTSMNTGPQATSGFDLALTEIVDEERHVFFVEAGSEHGKRIMSQIPCREATESDRVAAESIVSTAAQHIQKRLNTADLPELLARNTEHPHWEEVATRCLSCANCTMVCPTCFCMSIEDTTDLTGQEAERWRKWDSCFTLDFSYIHGGSVRSSVKARYRQWLTHKLSSWVNQFGTSGCVGCGRCITWCPVGIDLTQEVEALRESSGVPMLITAEE